MDTHQRSEGGSAMRDGDWLDRIAIAFLPIVVMIGIWEMVSLPW